MLSDYSHVPASTHLTTLLQYLSAYFAPLTSVLVVTNTSGSSALQLEYMDAVQQSLRNQTARGNIIGLQWINFAYMEPATVEELQQQLLAAVDLHAVEGFITILPYDTLSFLHARYYATRYTSQRLKDKLYLFLCERDKPQALLATQILQFYPHHLMITPAAGAGAGAGAEPQETQRGGRAKVEDELGDKLGGSALSNMARMRSNNHDRKPPSSPEPPRHSAINFELWTQQFMGGGGGGGNLAAVLLDAFMPNESFAAAPAKNVELYPNKLVNLMGRTVRLGSITYIPYVVTNYVPAATGNVDPVNPAEGNGTIFYVGSEAEIVKTFCKVHNCHLRVEPYGADNWGIIYENESSSGMLGDLYTQRVELAIGCIYNWYNDVTETSHAIARSAVTILGPAPAQYPAWRTPLMPFAVPLWIFLIVMILICAAVFCAIQMFDLTMSRWLTGQRNGIQNSYMQASGTAILEIFAVYIQQPSSPQGLVSFAARFFMATLLCATITLENTYSGQLKSILTIPLYGEAVDTMEKWSHTNWKWGAPSVVWIQTIDGSDLVEEQELAKNFETRDYTYLYNASFRGDYGLGIERLMSGAFSFGDFITAPALDTKIVPKDDLYFDWTVAVAIRGWPLMPLFNQHVRRCTETGLFVHWEREIVAKYLDRKTQEIMLRLASGHSTKQPPQKLTVANISGALFALLFGYAAATTVLLLEQFGRTLKQWLLTTKYHLFYSAQLPTKQ